MGDRGKSPQRTRSEPDRDPTIRVADIAVVATLIGNRTRLSMLNALVDERDLPATELARRAHVSTSTASEHLAKLVVGELVAVERRGRQRRYRLADAGVAGAVEALAAIAPMRPVQSLREATRGELLREGRTCYDHLAGRLGVQLTEALRRSGVIRRRDGAYILTSSGEKAIVDLGIDVTTLRQQRRAFAVPCLDWSERREHLAGALGAALAVRLFELSWIERVGRGRAATVTTDGLKALHSRFGLDL